MGLSAPITFQNYLETTAVRQTAKWEDFELESTLKTDAVKNRREQGIDPWFCTADSVLRGAEEETVKKMPAKN